MKIAAVQMPVGKDRRENIEKAARAALDAANNGARLVVLPEMFICPYSTGCFFSYSLQRGDETYLSLAKIAKDSGVTLVAGSVPEREGDRLYNTSFVFDEDGEEAARHRKMHLFDIDIAGGQRFFESDVLHSGDDITMFTAQGHTFGLCVCFDIRFPELFRIMALKGAEAIIVPAAFNMTTGPMHWELSFRMRAVDNQLFTIGVAPARDEAGEYVSYANSIAVSPWGDILARAGTGEETLLFDVDFGELARVRAQLPLLSARRTDIY